MTASRKCVALAGVVLGLIGLLCLGTVLASAAFSIGDIREFMNRGPSLALGAALGAVLIVLGGALFGPSRLRFALGCLRRDPALLVLNRSPWSVIEEFRPSDPPNGNDATSGSIRRSDILDRPDRFRDPFATRHGSRRDAGLGRRRRSSRLSSSMNHQ